MPDCGTQCYLCDLPIRFDTYKGCSHGCKYCFVQRKNTLEVGFGETRKALAAFVKGDRTKTTNWADWNIPLHWGGMSDPFQPCEKKYKRSLDCLKLLAETQYPIVISTKGRLCVEEPWLGYLQKANVVMQISALCSKYDEIEPGAPSFEERLRMIDKLSGKVKRVIVRAQPYIHDICDDMQKNIGRFADAGAHGVIFEGMKFMKKKKGLVKCGADWVQPEALLRHDFSLLREECHNKGLRFYSGENRLRDMGDSLTCCGVDDLEGFTVNHFNLNHLLNGDRREPSEGQRRAGTGGCFKALLQDTASSKRCYSSSFADMMEFYYTTHGKTVDSVFGINNG